MESIRAYWGAIGAGILLVPVGLFVAYRAWQASAPGQLARARRELALCAARTRRCETSVRRARDRADRLHRNRDSVKPRDLYEAEEALTDARALLRVAEDQVLVAKNQLRQVIYEEYPPARQDKLRRRYLPDDASDDRPFSF